MKRPKIVGPIDALAVVEGLCDATADEQVEAMQMLIDTGLVYTLPGSIGRLASDMIYQGICTPPKRR